MQIIKKIINWIMGLFQKPETPELDKKIDDTKERIKKIDKELEVEYTEIEESKKEWK
jgi:flagellar motility protein MotE (MotC chaperone)